MIELSNFDGIYDKASSSAKEYIRELKRWEFTPYSKFLDKYNMDAKDIEQIQSGNVYSIEVKDQSKNKTYTMFKYNKIIWFEYMKNDETYKIDQSLHEIIYNPYALLIQLNKIQESYTDMGDFRIFPNPIDLIYHIQESNGYIMVYLYYILDDVGACSIFDSLCCSTEATAIQVAKSLADENSILYKSILNSIYIGLELNNSVYNGTWLPKYSRKKFSLHLLAELWLGKSLNHLWIPRLDGDGDYADCWVDNILLNINQLYIKSFNMLQAYITKGNADPSILNLYSGVTVDNIYIPGNPLNRKIKLAINRQKRTSDPKQDIRRTSDPKQDIQLTSDILDIDSIADRCLEFNDIQNICDNDPKIKRNINSLKAQNAISYKEFNKKYGILNVDMTKYVHRNYANGRVCYVKSKLNNLVYLMKRIDGIIIQRPYSHLEPILHLIEYNEFANLKRINNIQNEYLKKGRSAVFPNAIDLVYCIDPDTERFITIQLYCIMEKLDLTTFGDLSGKSNNLESRLNEFDGTNVATNLIKDLSRDDSSLYSSLVTILEICNELYTKHGLFINDWSGRNVPLNKELTQFYRIDVPSIPNHPDYKITWKEQIINNIQYFYRGLMICLYTCLQDPIISGNVDIQVKQFFSGVNNVEHIYMIDRELPFAKKILDLIEYISNGSTELGGNERGFKSMGLFKQFLLQ